MLNTVLLAISLLDWIYAIITVAYIGTVLSIIGVVISENRNPVKSLGWITVLLMLPVLGIALYVFFGRSLKSSITSSQRLRKISQPEAKAFKADIDSLPLSASSRQAIHLASNMSHSAYYKDNKVDIFTDGKAKFEVLKQDLMNAERFIDMQYYIFEDDTIGNEIKDILIAKAHQGVKVRVIYDGVGAFNVNKDFFKSMLAAGVEAYPFMRITFPKFAQRVNWRNHRKIMVIDGKVGYIGGMNIADRYVKGCSWGTKKVWRDTHLRITGAAVHALYLSFAFDWNFMRKGLLNDMPPHAPEQKAGDSGIQLVTSGPMSEWNNVAVMMFNAINNAKKCIYLQTPYFLPTDYLLRALQAAALSGVKVHVMIPRQSDSAMLRRASYSYISECLKAGIHIYLYDAGMLHSKVLIVDDELSTAGSTNFDFRSFEHNYEGNVFIYDSKINSQLKEIFANDMLDCTECNLKEWQARPKSSRFVESLIRLLSPVL